MPDQRAHQQRQQPEEREEQAHADGGLEPLLAVGAHHPVALQDRDLGEADERGRDQGDREGEREEHDRLRQQHPATARAGFHIAVRGNHLVETEYAVDQRP